LLLAAMVGVVFWFGMLWGLAGALVVWVLYDVAINDKKKCPR